MTEHLTTHKQIIGVVGGAGAGKDTIANILSEHNFIAISASDHVRDQLMLDGLQINRKNQNYIANHLRENNPGYWVDRAIKDTNENSNIVISGLYAPCEAEYIKQKYNGKIIGVKASENHEIDRLIRFQRVIQRSDGPRDKLTWDDFIHSEIRENIGKTAHEANISSLMNLANFMIINSHDKDYLVEEVSGILDKIYKGMN